MSALPEPTQHTPAALDPRFTAGQNAPWQQRKDKATPRGVAVLESFYAARAENAELWDIEGRRYIDFASGIAVLNTGHRHPRVMAAVREQLDLFTHTAYQVVPYASYVALAERINDRLPGAWAKKTAFFTTGAEAVENAVKIARAATGRPGVIAFGGGFHGRTYRRASRYLSPVSCGQRLYRSLSCLCRHRLSFGVQGDDVDGCPIARVA